MVAINKRDLLEKTKELWPNVIDLSDHDEIGVIYSRKYTEIPVDDKWRQIALWAFAQGLWKLEQEAVADGLSTIPPQSLEYSTFEKWVRFRLDGEGGWAEGRIEWEDVA